MRCALDANFIAQSTVTFTSNKDGGWSIQIIESSRTGDREVDKFELTPEE